MQTIQQLSNLNARGGDTRSSIASFDNDKHLRALVWIMREEQAGFASQGAGIRGNFNLATPILMRKKLMPLLGDGLQLAWKRQSESDAQCKRDNTTG